MAGPYGDAVIIKSITGKDLFVYPDGAIKISGDVNLVGADIQMGAVEIKDGSSDNRVQVYSSGALRVSGDRLVSGNGDYGSVTVTASPSVIISGRADLKQVIFSPFGTMYFGLSNSVSSSNGEIMYSGDIYRDSGEGVYTGDIHGVTGAGSVDVRYQRRW